MKKIMMMALVLGLTQLATATEGSDDQLAKLFLKENSGAAKLAVGNDGGTNINFDEPTLNGLLIRTGADANTLATELCKRIGYQGVASQASTTLSQAVALISDAAKGEVAKRATAEVKLESGEMSSQNEEDNSQTPVFVKIMCYGGVQPQQ